MARRRARRCWTYRTGGGLVRGYGRAHAARPAVVTLKPRAALACVRQGSWVEG